MLPLHCCSFILESHVRLYDIVDAGIDTGGDDTITDSAGLPSSGAQPLASACEACFFTVKLMYVSVCDVTIFVVLWNLCSDLKAAREPSEQRRRFLYCTVY